MVGYTRLLCLSICFNHQHARSARSSNNFKHSSSSCIIFFFPSFSFSLSLLEHVRTNTQVAPLSILKNSKYFFLFKRENKFFSEKNYSNRLWWFIPNYIESELEKRQLAAIFPPSHWNVFHTLFGSFWDDYSLSLSSLPESLQTKQTRRDVDFPMLNRSAPAAALMFCLCRVTRAPAREREQEDELCRSRIVFIFRLIRIKCVEI